MGSYGRSAWCEGLWTLGKAAVGLTYTANGVCLDTLTLGAPRSRHLAFINSVGQACRFAFEDNLLEFSLPPWEVNTSVFLTAPVSKRSKRWLRDFRQTPWR